MAWLGLQAEQVGEVVRIRSVEAEAPGARLGLRSGMEIEVFVDGEPQPAGATALADAPEDSEVTLRGQGQSWNFVRPEMAFLGIQPARPRAADRRRYDLGPRHGVWVRSVIGEASAERAGIETDDILTQLEGRAVNNTNLRRVLAQLGAGTRAEATLIRDGEEMKLEVELGARR